MRIKPMIRNIRKIKRRLMVSGQRDGDIIDEYEAPNLLLVERPQSHPPPKVTQKSFFKSHPTSVIIFHLPVRPQSAHQGVSVGAQQRPRTGHRGMN
jgi:hypothetical protein